jgi:hypothetical protein
MPWFHKIPAIVNSHFPAKKEETSSPSCRHEVVIRYLLEQGADPFVTDVEMNISLHWAAFSGSKGITDLLLSAGCNVNQTNAIGGHGQCAPRFLSTELAELVGTVFTQPFCVFIFYFFYSFDDIISYHKSTCVQYQLQVLQIRINFIWIRIQHFRLNTDRDPE